MSTKQFVTQMKTIIKEIQSKGTNTIECDSLIAYLTEVENSSGDEPTPTQLEKYKAELQNWHEGKIEMFRSVIASGQNAIKSSFLLNGGASVALLAFISQLTQFQPDKVSVFATCLLPFTFGVLAISATSGFTYLSQWLFASNNLLARKFGFGFNIFCIFLGFSSYVFFAYGLLVAYRLFANYV
jgi:hypothetical protein